MATTTMSSREFNRDARKAKEAASSGPVFITNRGRLSHVLLTIEEYRQITGRRESIVELLAMPGANAVEFAAPKLRCCIAKRIVLS